MYTDRILIGPQFHQSTVISFVVTSPRRVTPTRRCCANIIRSSCRDWTSLFCPWEGVKFRLINTPFSSTSTVETLWPESGETLPGNNRFSLTALWKHILSVVGQSVDLPFTAHLSLRRRLSGSSWFLTPGLTCRHTHIQFLLRRSLCHNVVEISRQREIWRWLWGECGMRGEKKCYRERSTQTAGPKFILTSKSWMPVKDTVVSVNNI